MLFEKKNVMTMKFYIYIFFNCAIRLCGCHKISSQIMEENGALLSKEQSVYCTGYVRPNPFIYGIFPIHVLAG